MMKVHYTKAARCIRHAWYFMRHGEQSAMENPEKSMLLSAIVSGIKNDAGLQQLYHYRPATQQDAIHVGPILIQPDIIVLKNLEHPGMIKLCTSRTFLRKELNSGDLLALRMLRDAYAVDPRVLLVARDSLDITMLAPNLLQEEVDFTTMVAALEGEQPPPIPFERTTELDPKTLEFRSGLPNWPCGYCAYRGLCMQEG
ncbi:MAG: hypothetical protein QXS54_03135 [Candidatus Methanomethylicaceae archaeon]